MPLDAQVVGAFLVLCRIGTCMTLLPGLSTARVPVRVRLFLALALTLAVSPIVAADGMHVRTAPGQLLAAVLGECAIGALLGLGARLLIEAIAFSAAAIASYVGLGSPSGSIDGGEPQPAVASLISALAVLLVMTMELPQLVVITVVESYARLPQGAVPDTGAMLRHVAGSLGAAFRIGLGIAAPFLVYGVVVNLAFGILGRLVPQLPASFISGPFIAFGGLVLLWLAIGEMGHVMAGLMQEWRF